MAETTTSPEPGLEGECELSRQGIWQGHPGSCKGKYRRSVPTVDQMRFLFRELVYSSSLARARASSRALAKNLKEGLPGPDDTERDIRELNLTDSEAGGLYISALSFSKCTPMSLGE